MAAASPRHSQHVCVCVVSMCVVMKEAIKAPPGWFVGMMCVISFLLFIVVLVCIVKRRRGQQYPVDEKERQLGREGQPQDDRCSFGEYARR